MARRRVLAAVLGLLGAVFVGGVSQAYLWRWGLAGLGSVTGSQFMWVLLVFAVSWAWARGRPGPGAAAGALTGLALIGSYYALEWVSEGRHSVVAQFARARGPEWTLAAVGGGAVLGLLGAFAGTDAGRRPRLKALGIATPAVLVGVGAPAWLWLAGDRLDAATLVPAVAAFVLAAAALLVVAIRRCGLVPCLQALALSGGLGLAALSALLLLQALGWLYVTF